MATSDTSAAKIGPLSARTWGVAIIFGLIALVIVISGLTIPIPATTVVTDPREIFTTTGSALTGPFGGILIGLLAGIREPGGIVLASLLGHIAGCIWMGWAYKHLVYLRLEMPVRLLGWVGLVLVYYFLLVVPGFVIGIAVFYPDIYAEFEASSIFAAYWALAKGAVPEALLTSLITALMMAGLPEKYRRPLW